MLTTATCLPLQTDEKMNEIMTLAHAFLQNFCRGNPQNQALLHKHLTLFLTPGVSVSPSLPLSAGRRLTASQWDRERAPPSPVQAFPSHPRASTSSDSPENRPLDWHLFAGTFREPVLNYADLRNEPVHSYTLM